MPVSRTCCWSFSGSLSAGRGMRGVALAVYVDRCRVQILLEIIDLEICWEVFQCQSLHVR